MTDTEPTDTEPTDTEPTETGRSSQAPVGGSIRRDVVRVAGPDAGTYLQGQISQDVDALAVATSTWTFVLQPQGKVDAWARLTKTAADEFLLDVDGGHGEALVARLRRFLLRTRAEIDLLDWPAVAVRGTDVPHDDLPEGVLRLRAAGPAVVGFDLIGPGAVLPDGVEEVDAAVLDAYRIERGVPAMGRELDDSTIPAEVGQWIIDESVSFAKGCYVGQELTARIDSRGGNVARRLRALVLDAPVEAGTEVSAEGPCGPVTSSTTSPAHGPIALAFCGRAVGDGASVDVEGVSGVVRELPLV